MSLEAYRQRRDFRKTAEPRGEKVAGARNRFVVHEHHASHLHYDFRLDMDGVLKSWAVPKGIPLETGVRRLAVQTEDHPVEYIDFSGAIPVGEYGAGTVAIWDSGTYELDKQEPKEISFTLNGKRLSGGYVLVNTNNKNWILLKRKAR
jgi:DNA ligase D-like protein (predicted 3'-phosphoesterase)